jgi:hypothetical protein
MTNFVRWHASLSETGYAQLNYAANMVLEHTLERHIAGGKYCDIPLGIYMVKGDTVVLTGELVSGTISIQRTQ